MKDSHKVMHVHNPKELAEIVKAYVDLEWSKDQEDSITHGYLKELLLSSKQEVYE